jgi:translation initiation factor 2 subunit 2
MGQAADMFQL